MTLKQTGKIGSFGSALLVVGVSMLASCADVAPKGDVPAEVVVRQRAQERWDAMLAGDVGKAYSYMSPAARETISLESFRNSIRLGFWKKAEVTGVRCESSEDCEVTLQLTYSYRGSTIQSPAKEAWVKSDGNWWQVFRPG